MDMKGLSLARDGQGLYLTDDELSLRLDFRDMLPRLRQQNLERELLVKAAGANRRKGSGPPEMLVLDATAGLGEDSLLLAAAGCRVLMYERNPVMAALLSDALQRAGEEPQLKETAARMRLFCGDSIAALAHGLAEAGERPEVIYLDPMFPKRQKSALVGKKFQLLHRIEQPCEDEEGLLRAAIQAGPDRIVIKRPVKGPFLADIRPDFSLSGKAVRYDCLLPASRKDL